jgi:hypothetical protein
MALGFAARQGQRKPAQGTLLVATEAEKGSGFESFSAQLRTVQDAIAYPQPNVSRFCLPMRSIETIKT